MSDLINRLRTGTTSRRDLCDEAADEIERLRAALQAALDLMVIDYDGYPAVDMARAALADQGKPETLSQG